MAEIPQGLILARKDSYGRKDPPVHQAIKGIVLEDLT
jgi:hypothetical protein